MNKKILVTGVNGFVGKHLVREFISSGYLVVGVGREDSVHPEIASLLSAYHVTDLTKPDEVGKLPLNDIQAVISLAGLAQVGDSFKDPEKYLRINVDVTTVIAEEILRRKLQVRFIAISTGAVYATNQPMPITEEGSALAKEGSPYAKSKILMEEALSKLREQDLECVVVRPFNHIGPGQEPGFLVPDLYQKLKAAAVNLEPVKVGNLSTKRDYTDVRDVVRAYASLATAESLQNTLYNVCSGKSVAGQDILNFLLDQMGLVGKVQTTQDPGLIRPNDPQDIYGSSERLQKETDWQPQITTRRTISDYVKMQLDKE